MTDRTPSLDFDAPHAHTSPTHVSRPAATSFAAPDRTARMRHTAAHYAVASLLAVALSSPAAANAQGQGEFWRAPSLGAYINEVYQAQQRHTEMQQGADTARAEAEPGIAANERTDVRLDRMKEWLAKGVVAAPPSPRASWADVQALAHRIGVVEFPDALRGPRANGASADSITAGGSAGSSARLGADANADDISVNTVANASANTAANEAVATDHDIEVEVDTHRVHLDAQVQAFTAAGHGVEALNDALGLWSGGLWLRWAEGAPTPHAAALVRAIRLPAANASWLTSDRQIALGRDGAEQLSGRFGIVHRVKHSAGMVAAPGMAVSSDGTAASPGDDRAAATDGAGLPSRLPRDETLTVSLTRPLVRTVIHRDGKLDATTTHARAAIPLWPSEVHESCEGFVPGFGMGDADADFHAALSSDAYTRSQSPHMHPVGSVVSIVTRDAPPVQQAVPSVTTHALDEAATGFASATQLAYDLDGDGSVDLVVWEGRGAPSFDGNGIDRNVLRHRLFFANVDGDWQLLGHDSPMLECGPGC